MPYDRYGRTPEQARRERAQEWLCVLVLVALLFGICASMYLVTEAIVGAWS